MFVTVTGGAASGKSAYAEDLTMSLGEKRVYLATMEAYGREGQDRIRRHRALREGKGFTTIEQAGDLDQIDPSRLTGAAVLVEDLSNLLADELYRVDGLAEEETVYAKVLKEMDFLVQTSRHVVLVTNQVFSDGILYGRETEIFLRLAGRLDRALAGRADACFEVVCGIPLCLKKTGPSSEIRRLRP